MWFPLICLSISIRCEKYRLRSFLALKSLQLPVTCCHIDPSFLIILTSLSELGTQKLSPIQRNREMISRRDAVWSCRYLLISRTTQHISQKIGTVVQIWNLKNAAYLRHVLSRLPCATITFSVRMLKLRVGCCHFETSATSVNTDENILQLSFCQQIRRPLNMSICRDKEKRRS
jgi:hypothetical protein